jgi:sphingolipid delta-4 desaturase
LTHHKSLGVDGLDTDLPTSLEAFVLDSILGKAFFCTFQIFFYAIRPIAVFQIPMTWIHLFNIAAQLVFDAALVRLASPTALLYLLLSSFLAGSLHPLAGHFIAEHYVYEPVTPSQRGAGPDSPGDVPIPETFSYYGPLNLLAYNVGLHNEHHDFPAVPWTRLPALHAIAREFYADLPRHSSWPYVMWRFIWDDQVGIQCRVKRKSGGRMVGGGAGYYSIEYNYVRPYVGAGSQPKF